MCLTLRTARWLTVTAQPSLPPHRTGADAGPGRQRAPPPRSRGVAETPGPRASPT